MIIIIGFAVKFLICVILLHAAMTTQELHFNPLGKLVASVTNPVYMNMLKMTKKRTDALAPLFIAGIAVFYGIIVSFFGGSGLIWGFFYAFDDILRFILLFYIIAVLVGSTTNRFGTTSYSTFFYRIALPWVKLTRTFVNLPGNTVVIPAMVVLFVLFIAMDTLFHLGFYMSTTGGVQLIPAVKGAAAGSIKVLLDLLGIFTWLIIIRALMSWVSPDPRNPVVQFVIAMTEPVMEPFRKIIPPLGFMDISPIILLIVIYFARMMLVSLIGLL
ncbi:YggT family protein [Geovibrio thiophilus]|nr:YggT family protein [Geovibrio thiophilus]